MQDETNWKQALNIYVHTHNTMKPHSRLGITPFELLVGWKYRGTFVSLWVPPKQIDRDAVRDKDAEAKLVSKKYADLHRGAKESNITIGDRVLLATKRHCKTDPTFSKEKYTIIARDGAKVIIQSDRGVQITRNIQDVKSISNFELESQESLEASSKEDRALMFGSDNEQLMDSNPVEHN
ncbi:uncharacterized protein LOC134214359 isoform X1 [Armigeres subalbatus]|uniref:uncharacterized protein LOC134214359 isoform X1 n=1 Tax=Armigeres subalbatus TaxID=124917 RepID=UPI002ED39907